ncbi:MAG TPA: type IV pilin protein [Methylibium sp.]|uniref:type IV pilin protein n=1 Tax=Methylibium sp. TaxID=2067992 RepID=UPI002DBA85F9|nr:type IV pilin protein [Methylibium sp.]HEU4457541.1 type IV pilin protein [Methylibium sp.]
MARGFSLIELLVALSAAAVLAGIALPSFSQALQRSRRIEAVTALMQLQLAQERWRSSHPGYADDLASLGLDAAAGRHYRLAILDSGIQRYTAVATAVGAQAGDAACTSLGLTLSGATQTLHSTGRASTAECWRR